MSYSSTTTMVQRRGGRLSRNFIRVDPQLDTDAVRRRIKKAAFRKHLSWFSRAEIVAETLGFVSCYWGRDKVLEAMKWKPFEDEWRRIRIDHVRGRWNSRVPEFRITLRLVQAGTKPLDEEAEDRYAWAIIVLTHLMKIRVDSTKLAGWIWEAADQDEVTFIFFHLLLFRHYREKAERWKEKCILRRAGYRLTGSARKQL